MNPINPEVLVLGIGNVLLGDEGVGVSVVRHLLDSGWLPPGVEVLDGGTGSMVLLGPMRAARRMILVDATLDGQTPGTVRRLEPRFASDFPPSLTAHDIGLKDLLDSFYLLGERPEVVLFTVTVEEIQDLRIGLSRPVAEAIPEVVERIHEELAITEALWEPWVHSGQAPQD